MLQIPYEVYFPTCMGDALQPLNPYRFFIFMEKIIKELSTYYHRHSRSICENDKQLILECDLTFAKICKKIKKEHQKIRDYFIQPTRPKEKLFRAESVNFKIEFKVYKELTSEIIIEKKSILRQKFDSLSLQEDIQRNGYVYFVKSEYGYKIGCTKDLDSRMNNFSIQLPFKFNLHSTVETSLYYELEKMLHELLQNRRINGEWFSIDECDFIIVDEFDKVKKNEV